MIYTTLVDDVYRLLLVIMSVKYSRTTVTYSTEEEGESH